MAGLLLLRNSSCCGGLRQVRNSLYKARLGPTFPSFELQRSPRWEPALHQLLLAGPASMPEMHA